MPSLGGWEFVILIGILVLLFGAKRLPDMARSIGQSARVFKGEMKGMKSDEAAKSDDKQADSAAPSTPQALPEAKTRSEAPAQEKAADPARASQPGSGSSVQ
ncbi:Sec-independent protein translocase subunit TatA [Pseudonocardia kunmingensis]|uniref:Sec-independent protein translocase protein TatA n=1 Tax=Pseudonocardia kunmingensis TaxID=630975 RepID=A0A543D3F2_9PSEU|nr:Sec-independent protein translocase subunit TatA [Pseudonocardia kunmingensis]TQM03859.1 sec-independent protein translocase protein TatA [Pseudonocardia kunmingensis]